jgi:hypothetical protein
MSSSLLLGVGNWKFFEGLLCAGFIVQRPVQDCRDELETFFFTK